MKPPPFEYHDPSKLDEALSLVATHADEGKVMAGGQSLIPMLNFRLAHPAHIIDINGVRALGGLVRRGGALRIGATCRQSSLERSRLVMEHWPLLAEALGFVAHPQIRNRGTVGGSAVHADPTAELPVAFAALNARFHVGSSGSAQRRVVDAEDFFVTHLTTALERDELLVEIEVPPVPARTGHAFVEFARRDGDFALGGAAVLVTRDGSGNCTRAAITLLGAAPTPLRADAAEELLIGGKVDGGAATEAAERAVEGIRPVGDAQGSSEYRQDLIQRLVCRAIFRAAERSVAAERTGGAGDGQAD